MSKKTAKKINEMSAMAGGAITGASSTDYFINREDFLKELQLREVIRGIISTSESKKQNLQEKILRKVIQNLILEAETDTTPHASTAINFLEELLKKILPGIEKDFKSLTTNVEQRESFRAQVVSSVETMLETASVNIEGAKEEESGEEVEGFIDIEEDIEINVADDEKFIDIDPDAPEEEENEEEVAANDTGAKLASQSFDAIEKQIMETYSTLSEEEDQKTFHDYLITNLKLYFDKWEKELGDVVEPTTDEYETEKEEGESEELGDELGGEDELGAEEEFGEEELEL
tara:strand:+ start:1731 stop:2597 length:867 start_codon:yes stop_codon:yes gene_type:complete